MSSLVAPAIVLASAAALAALAIWRLPVVHMAAAAATAALLASLALAAGRQVARQGGSPGHVAGIHARHAGYVLAWAAVSVLVTYTAALVWDEWWQFFAAFAVLGALVMLLARTLISDAAKGPDDAAMLIIARFLAWLLTLGGAGAAIGLLVDKKMTRFMTPRYTDWAANNAFFFGGIALAVLGWAILSATRRPKP